MMDKEKELFNAIAKTLSEENKNVDIGKMMSSPGIMYKFKNFTFFNDNEMIFRVGKSTDLQKLGVNNPRYLNPFKSKPAMKGWIHLSWKDKGRWEEFARIALNVMKKELE